MISLSQEQAHRALEAMGWTLTEADGEIVATHPCAEPISALARHNRDWAYGVLLGAALNLKNGLGERGARSASAFPNYLSGIHGRLAGTVPA